MLRYVGNRVPGLGEVFCRFAAHTTHRYALDLAPFRKIRQLWPDEVSRPRRRLDGRDGSGQYSFRVSLDVVFVDTSAGPRTFHLIDVEAQFACQAAYVGRGWDGRAVFGPGNLSQLHRHGESRRLLSRLIGRQRLLFRFSLRPNCRLECKPGSVLSGNVFHGCGCGRSFGCRRASTLEGEDHLSDFNLLAFFNFYFLDHASDRRGHFDDCFVGFEFHHGLAFRHVCARGDHEPHQVALRDVFTEFGELEFAGAGRIRDLAGLCWRRRSRSSLGRFGRTGLWRGGRSGGCG